MQIKVEGLQEVCERFNTLPKRLRVTMQIANARALRDIQKTAQQSHRFHTRTGLLERSITKEEFTGTIGGRVYLDDTMAAYGPFVHQGTRPHDIKPREKTVLRWPVRGGFVFSKHVHHPGTRPDQFIFRGGRINREHVRDLYREAIKEVTK